MSGLRAGWPALLLNALVLGLFAWAVEHYWGWGKLLAPWRNLELAVLLLAVCGMLLSYGVRALRIYLAERDIPRGQYLACLRLILINNVVNLLLPARSGEASFPILMKRWFGIDPARATGTLIWLRLLDLHVLATIGAACAAGGWLGASMGLSHLAWIAAGAAAVSPLLLFVLRGPLAAKLAGHEGKLAALLARVLNGLPRRYTGLGLDLGLSWLSWSIKLAALGWVLSRLAQIPQLLGTLGAIGGDLSTVLPVHAPGGFGTYEAGVMALLAPGATPSGALLAGAVNLHLLVLTTALLAGAAAWAAGGAKRPADARL
ncbi:MAG TPA: lysylphosphatidylglycerol synthase domain-containing protein [Nevskia sp.]|nr:lysylphosphatidylglycerol synthase domain-containing protein [Nevskia sp.]